MSESAWKIDHGVAKARVIKEGEPGGRPRSSNNPYQSAAVRPRDVAQPGHAAPQPKPRVQRSPEERAAASVAREARAKAHADAKLTSRATHNRAVATSFFRGSNMARNTVKLTPLKRAERAIKGVKLTKVPKVSGKAGAIAAGAGAAAGVGYAMTSGAKRRRMERDTSTNKYGF